MFKRLRRFVKRVKTLFKRKPRSAHPGQESVTAIEPVPVEEESYDQSCLVQVNHAMHSASVLELNKYAMNKEVPLKTRLYSSCMAMISANNEPVDVNAIYHEQDQSTMTIEYEEDEASTCFELLLQDKNEVLGEDTIECERIKVSAEYESRNKNIPVNIESLLVSNEVVITPKEVQKSYIIEDRPHDKSFFDYISLEMIDLLLELKTLSPQGPVLSQHLLDQILYDENSDKKGRKIRCFQPVNFLPPVCQPNRRHQSRVGR